MRRRNGWITALLTLAACGGPALTPAPPPPAPAPSRSAASAAAPSRLVLPARLPTTTWRVRSVARVTVTGSGVTGAATDEQGVESTGLVSWSAERQPSGALRATGLVDSFTVRTSFGAQRGAMVPSSTAMVLLEGTLDSTLTRISTRPPLINECDRPEAGAASLARDLLVRVPNGLVAGDRWKDSFVALICRSGVPLTVYTTIVSRLERLAEDRLVVRRELTSRLEGKGGSAFRALELAGTAQGSQLVEIAPLRGTVERLEGSGTLTLTATERLPGAPVRTQQITQRTELTAVRR